MICGDPLQAAGAPGYLYLATTALNSGSSKNARVSWCLLVSSRACDASTAVFLTTFFPMKNQKFASPGTHPPADYVAGRSFDTLSRILTALMCASVIFFALLFLPVELSPLMERLTGWCVAGLLAALVCIVVVGLIEQLAD